MNERLIAVGDVHGCAAALKTLLETIQPSRDDTLVILGDVVDRGPASKEAVDLLLSIAPSTNLITLLGNHEEMMLQVLEGEAPHRWLQFGGIETLESYGFTGDFSVIPPLHRQFYEAMQDFYETDEFFFTHAAYKHDLPLEYQPGALLRWHSLRDGLPPAHESGKTCFVGHTSHKDGEIVDCGHLVCLDTYCYGGGWLTAMDVRTRRTWQADRTGRLRED